MITQINQVTKHVEISPIQLFVPVLMVVEVPVLMQGQVSHTAWKTVKGPWLQFIDKFVPPAICQVTKHVEIPLIQYTNKHVAVPIVIQRQVPQV